MFIRKNVATHPELKKLSIGKFYTKLTAHARERSFEKGFSIPNNVVAGPGSVVEVEIYKGVANKAVVRINYNNYQDLVLVIAPIIKSQIKEFRVITAWLNNKEDNHKSLDKTRISI